MILYHTPPEQKVWNEEESLRNCKYVPATARYVLFPVLVVAAAKLLSTFIHSMYRSGISTYSMYHTQQSITSEQARKSQEGRRKAVSCEL